jgi:hypothetical protein
VHIDRIATSLAYFTEFSDGTRLVSSNNVQSPLVPPVGVREGSAAFPEIHDVRRLYEIHQAALSRFASDGVRQLPALDDPAEYLGRSAFEEHSKQIATGYYSLDEVNRCFRSTWKGAIFRGLKLRWPLKQLHNATRRRRARTVLWELGIE